MKKLLLLIYFFTIPGWAAEPPRGIGEVALHLMGPVSYLSDFIYTACFVIGGSFIFASVIKYIAHRSNPLAVTISSVIFLFLSGVALIALPFAYLIMHQGLPYTLFK